MSLEQKNKAPKVKPHVSLMSLSHFHTFWNLLLNKCMPKLNLFVLYDKKQNVVNGATSSMCLSSNISLVRNLSKCIRNSAYNIIPTCRIHSKSPHHKQIFFIWLQSYTFCSISGGRLIHYLQNRINLYGKQVFLYLW